MNTNEKGNIGLIKVIADLYSKGFYCFTPFDDYSPVDLIALSATGKTYRLQIKYRSPEKYDRYELSARSIVNGKSTPIDRTMIDSWAVYLSDIDAVVYFPVDLMEGKSCHYIKRDQIDNLKILDS